uniref:ATP-dependent Clp protease proteolytic subunit n=1 Tax=Nardostachys jatamansi TaxID=179860 RepID=A0A7U3PYP8_9DIPS|nr:ATP-dependent Clp protease proteolytic subunit [Nardostachys jatamansi]QPG86282.1 ATP-dependent Clp protease proteolytic subunit [Nardostachys jatamansi]
MPIGVPKIPFLIPGDDEGTWVDIYVLYRKRLLFLGEDIDSEVGNQVIGIIVFLTIEDNTQDQYMFINSPGGSVPAGLSIYDMMQSVKPDIHTMAVGVVASMASFILVGGTTTKRIAFPHRVMIHQPATGFFMAPAGFLAMEIGLMLDIRNVVTEVYARRTGKPFAVIWADMDRDLFMSATEAKAYGIVDFVGE